MISVLKAYYSHYRENRCSESGIIVITSRNSNRKPYRVWNPNENDHVLSEDFVKVADAKDIRPSHMKEVQADGENICVVNVEGKILRYWQYLHA